MASMLVGVEPVAHSAMLEVLADILQMTNFSHVSTAALLDAMHGRLDFPESRALVQAHQLAFCT
jgi:hypothetical protein